MGKEVLLLTPAGGAVDGEDKLVLVLIAFMLNCRGSISRGEERHQVRVLRDEAGRQQNEMRVHNRLRRSHEQETSGKTWEEGEGINGLMYREESFGWLIL